MSTQYKQLHRSRQGRILGGVCSGLAEYFDIDPTLVRLGFVFGSILGWLGALVLIYLIMWIVVPEAQGSIIEKSQPTPSPTGDT
jgi:phage shock protein C